MPNKTERPRVDIPRFKKNGESNGEVLRIEVSEFQGRNNLNIRIWYTDDHGELKPTQKGVLVPVEQLDQLLFAIGECTDFLKEFKPEAS